MLNKDGLDFAEQAESEMKKSGNREGVDRQLKGY